MRLKKVDVFLVAFLGVLVALTVLFVFRPELGTGLSISSWIAYGEAERSLALGLGIVALASLLGAFIPVPVPYPLAVSVIVLWDRANFLWVAGVVLVGAAANWFGDALDYVLGRGARELMDVETTESIEKWTRLIEEHPHLTPLLVFITALTPLPESVIFVPLGITKYSVKKVLFWSFLGKIGMMVIAAAAGLFALTWLLDLIGGEGGSWIPGMALLYVSWLIMVLVIKVDVGGDGGKMETENAVDE
ncbi:MAG: VTT domain-containing protein [Promethearchaeota archaeon]